MKNTFKTGWLLLAALLPLLFLIAGCSAKEALAPFAQALDTAVPRRLPATWTPPPLEDTPDPGNPSALAVDRCIPIDTEVTAGRVTNVIDGDTIEVEIGGSLAKVRYIGINAPETGSKPQPFGKAAAELNSGLVLGKAVTLVKEESDADASGNLLRYVLVGDLFVNKEIVKQGYGYAAARPPDIACEAEFRRAEQIARENVRGLWGKK